jgi:hypothetical protein
MISHQELKEYLNYDPGTGLFTWIKSPRRNVKAGAKANYVDNKGYVRVAIKNAAYSGHRLAWFYMYGEWPSPLDHIDHVKTNNRIANLREADHSENQKNISMPIDNTSGCVGVTWAKRANKWQAQIKSNGKYLYLGQHSDINAAILTRKVVEFAYGFHPNHGAKVGGSSAGVGDE